MGGLLATRGQKILLFPHQVRVTGRVSRPPCLHLLNRGQATTPVQERRVQPVLGPPGGVLLQLRVEDPAGLLAVEPATQPGPRAQQYVVTDLDGIPVQDQQAAAGEGLEHSVYRAPGGIAPSGGQVGPEHSAAGEPTIQADQDQSLKDLPGDLLPSVRQGPIHRLSAELDAAGDSAGIAISRYGQAVTVTLPPGQHHGLRQQRQDALGLVLARCPQVREDRVGQVGVDAETSRSRRAGDRLPQFRRHHRADHEHAILHQPGQPGMGGAPGPEVAADRDDH